MLVTESFMRVFEDVGLDMVFSFPTKAKHVAVHLSKTGKPTLEIKEESPVRTPWGHNRTSGARPNLLHESYNYLGGFGEGNSKKEPYWNASAEYHERFAEHVTGSHPALKALLGFFKKGPYDFSEELGKEEQALSMVFYFDGVPICELPELEDAIRATHRAEFTYSGEYLSDYDDNPCILDSHFKVHFPGMGQSQSLLGANKKATWNGVTSHDKMAPMAMSYEAMAHYAGGLAWLSKNCCMPYIRGKEKDSPEINALVWVEGGPHRIIDIYKKVFRGCPEGTKIKEHAEQVQKLLDNELFTDETKANVLLLLTGTRIAVRGYHVMTVAQLAERLVAYLDNFSVSRGSKTIRTMVTPWQLCSLGKFPVTTKCVEQLYRAIFLGGPYPEALRKWALAEYTKDNDNLLTEGVLNAFKGSDMEHPKHPSFQAGRLFAAYEYCCDIARDKGDRKNAITALLHKVHRNQSYLYSRPVVWIVEKHKEKIKALKRDSYEREIQDIKDALYYKGEALPRRASRKEEYFFTLGRDYQKARIIRHKAKRAEPKAKEETAEDLINRGE